MLTKRVPQVTIAVTWTPKGGAEIVGSQHDVCRRSTRLVKYHVLDLMNGAGTNTISVARGHEKRTSRITSLAGFGRILQLGTSGAGRLLRERSFCRGRSSEFCSEDLLQEAVSLVTKLAMHVTPSAAVSSVPLTLDGRTQNENHKTVSVLIGATHSGNSDPISRLASLGATAMFARPRRKRSQQLPGRSVMPSRMERQPHQ
ncbi:hypothetical protein BD769DRAFT_1391200 [Suillus cothurnatus]|nr:hypothetical protein BD769DRAFT_1394856 [Suillus cothurnatus]KAG2115712.1 hypothetical protein BD769DRAFT_1391200 [Suillus cothurnatus]